MSASCCSCNESLPPWSALVFVVVLLQSVSVNGLASRWSVERSEREGCHASCNHGHLTAATHFTLSDNARKLLKLQ